MQVVQKIKTLACQMNLFSERVINVRNDMICPLMQLILRLLLHTHTHDRLTAFDPGQPG